jgi:hypothetical protein
LKQVLKGLALGLVGYLLFTMLPVLGLLLSINNTILNSQFIITEIEKLDIADTAQEALVNQIPAEYKSYADGIKQTIIENKPWINQQISDAVNSLYEFLLGNTENLNYTITTGPIKQSLVDNLTEVYLKTPAYVSLPAAQKSQYLAQLQQQILDIIPATIEINQNTFGAQVEQTLKQAKDIVQNLRTAYFWLIPITLGLILIVILIQRETRAILRTLGIIFLVDGVLCAGSFLLLSFLIPGLIPQSGLPAQLQTWIPQAINDLLSPWGTFSFTLLVGGLIMTVVSFLIHKNTVTALQRGQSG